MTKQRNRHFLVDRGNLTHLLPSIKLMIIATKEQPHTRQSYNKQGKLEPTTFSSYSQIYIHHSIPIQQPSMLWLSINTLRRDSTHSDTYNLVGFSGCLHLWWIPLLTPELCVTSVMMNQISLTTRLAFNELWASCYT